MITDLIKMTKDNSWDVCGVTLVLSRVSTVI